jgi:fission 1 protein
MVTRHRNTGKGRAEDGGNDDGSLPLAVDAAMSLSPEELGVLQEQYVLEQDKGFVSTQTKFNLAW